MGGYVGAGTWAAEGDDVGKEAKSTKSVGATVGECDAAALGDAI